MKKRTILILLAATLALSMTACGNSKVQAKALAQSSSNMLVAYFTYAENADLPDGVDASSSASIQIWDEEITGNTGAVAHMIREATGAEVFSIQTVEKYLDSY